MAKVLLINGSPKENGNTFTALSEVAKTLNEEGVETDIISIGKQAVQGSTNKSIYTKHRPPAYINGIAHQDKTSAYTN